MKKIISIFLIMALFTFILPSCSVKQYDADTTGTTDATDTPNTPDITDNTDNNDNVGHETNTTFSAPINEINGTIYCARKVGYVIEDDGLYQNQDVPTCTLIPVEVGQYNMVASFCYYDGYVYYVETEGGSSSYNTWLYRCKPDWSGKELLHSIVIDESSVYEGERFFVIDNGILYYGSYGTDSEVTTIDLDTLQKGISKMPRYIINDNGADHDGSYSDEYDIKIYNNKTFFTDDSKNLYMKDSNGNTTLLADHAYLDGGLAGDYLYYAEYNWQAYAGVKLYRISLITGEREYIDSTMPAGGGGPFFCW